MKTPEQRYSESFLDILSDFDLITLEQDPHSIYAVSENFELIYFNPAWFHFSAENNGEPGISSRFTLGTSLWSGITGVLKNYYLENYMQVLVNGKVGYQDYECSSPEEYRLFRQSIYPLRNKKGLIIQNNLRIKQPIITSGIRKIHLLEECYRAANGFITQCSNCRKVQRVDAPEIWDWVTSWVKNIPAETSHSICPTCLDYFWKFRYSKKN